MPTQTLVFAEPALMVDAIDDYFVAEHVIDSAPCDDRVAVDTDGAVNATETTATYAHVDEMAHDAWHQSVETNYDPYRMIAVAANCPPTTIAPTRIEQVTAMRYVVIIRAGGNLGYNLQSGGLAPLANAYHEYSIGFTWTRFVDDATSGGMMTQTAWGNLRSEVAAGNARISVHPRGEGAMATWVLGDFDVAYLALEIDYVPLGRRGIPPLRLTQRADGRTGGAPRLLGNNSRQSTNRLLGTYL